MTVTVTRLPALEVLWSAPSAVGPRIDELSSAYGGSLRFPTRRDRPTVIVNFVSTLDGVVSYATPEAAGGGEISGFFGPDRFVMGLLRAHADAVVIGAGTLRAAPEERWTPDYIYRDAANQFRALRRTEGLPPQPTTVVVSRSGDLDLAHPGLADPNVPVLIATQSPIETPPHGAVIGGESLPSLIDALGQRGMRLVLCEGGPHLLGQLITAGLVDELFLTVAPQLAGRDQERPRLSLIEGTAFSVAEAPWWNLISVARVDDHLFLRYRRTTSKET